MTAFLIPSIPNPYKTQLKKKISFWSKTTDKEERGWPFISEARTCNNGLKKYTTKGKATRGFWRDGLSMAKTECRWPTLHLKKTRLTVVY